MPRRLALLWTPLVLAVAFMMPGTAAGAEPGFRYSVIYNYCGGDKDETVFFKVKQTADGSTTANLLTIDGKAQRRIHGSWQTVHTWDRQRYEFTADGNTHWQKVWRSYVGNDFYWFRIVFKLRFWHNANLLALATIHSVRC
jgi:hypothetical protein